MKISLFAALSLLFGACAIRGQYKVVVPGTGDKTAFIAQNPTIGTNGSCYTMRTTDPTTHVLHDTGRACGAFDVTGYGNARTTIETVTGDSVFQNNTTWKGKGQIIGGTSGPSWETPNDFYLYLIAPTEDAQLIIESTTSAPTILMRNGGGASNTKTWDMIAAPNAFHFRVTNDAYTTAVDWLAVARTGTTPTSATFSETLLFDTDNVRNIGSSTVAAANIFSTGMTLGRGFSHQGTATFSNTSTGASFLMAGTAVATGGADVAVGNLAGASSIYPVNSSTDLGYSAGRYRKIWVTDIDISGTCTGCVSGAANQTLSNLTNPTALNQNLNTTHDIFVTGGANVHVQDGAGHDLVEMQNAGGVGNFLVNDAAGVNKIILNAFGVDVATGLSFNVGGLSGQTHTVVTGTCTMNFSGGVLTSTSGC